MRHYDAVAGNRLPDAICRFSSAGCHLSAVVYRLSAVRCVCLGAAMRFCPGSCINRLMWAPGQKSLSWFAKTGVFSRTGTIPVAPVCASIVLRENRDGMLISGLAVFCRFCLSGYVDFGDWLVLVLENGPKLRTGTTISAPGVNVNRLTPVPGQIRAREQ